jgi:hypothetical protein
MWTSGLITTTSYGTSANWKTAYDWGNHASVGYLTSLPSHNHDDRYFTETESDGRFQPLENQRLSTSNSPTFVEVYASNWFRNTQSNEGFYNEVTTQHLSSNSNGYWDMSSTTTYSGIRFYTGGHVSALRGYIYANTSNEIGFLNTGGNWSLRCDNSQNVHVTTAVYAPIYYDSADNNYYLNPNGTSNLKTVKVNSTVAGTDALTVDGVNGRLFTITDDMTSSIFSVNTISGLPVMEAFADYKVVMGRYGQNDFHLDTNGNIAMGASPVSGVKLFVNGNLSIGGANSGYTFYNNGTSYLNGSVYVDDNLTIAGGYALKGNYGTWTGEENKIQWHSNNLYFQNTGGGEWIFRNSSGSNVFRVNASGEVNASGNIYGGFILGTYFNASSGNSENPTIGQIWTQDTSDNYLRKSTPAHFISQLGLITSSNIGSQSVNYSTTAGSLTSMNISQFTNNSGYITGNQTITLSGDVSGSGTTSIVVTVNNIDGWGFVNTGSNNATNADTIDSNGISYYDSGVTNFSGNATDGALYSQRYSGSWQHQIAGDYRSGMIAVRGRNNGTWTSWRTVIDSGNIGSQTVATAGSLTSMNISQFTNNSGYITSYVDTNYYVTGATFNTSTGVITMTRNDGGTVTVDIDGKYAESSHTHDDRYFTETESDNRFQPLENQRVSTGNSPTFSQVFTTQIGINDSGIDCYMEISDENPTEDGIGYGGVFTFYGDKSVTLSHLYFGGAYVYNNLVVGGRITENSSIRYKKDIETLEGGLDKVLAMRGVTYVKKDTGVKEVGLIAEELAEILPEVVGFDTQGQPDSVSYSRLTAILVEAIKDLKKEIDELKGKK